jgi:hypothetical protein
MKPVAEPITIPVHEHVAGFSEPVLEATKDLSAEF